VKQIFKSFVEDFGWVVNSLGNESQIACMGKPPIWKTMSCLEEEENTHEIGA